MRQGPWRGPSAQRERREGIVRIFIEGETLLGDLAVPDDSRGLVMFAHGSGSSRRSPRNRSVAGHLREAGLATLLLDLLTPEESVDPSSTFDLRIMALRLEAATSWAASRAGTASLPIGYFGASTGAAVALLSAAELGEPVRAVVSRGGRPDLVGPMLAAVRCPTLLIVGSRDEAVLDLNRRAYDRLGCAEKELSVIAGATHLFEEEGAIEAVARRAAFWFRKFLTVRTRDDGRIGGPR